MLGFAALDHQPGGPVAVWLVSRTEPAEASSTNAVVIEADDPELQRKVHGLTRDRVVVLTPGSSAEGLPVDGAHEVDLLARLTDATRAHQEAIVAAIRAHAASRKGQKLVEPTFPATPEAPAQWPGTPELRALQLARWLGRVWTTGWSATANGCVAPPNPAPASPRGSCRPSSTSPSCWSSPHPCPTPCTPNP